MFVRMWRTYLCLFCLLCVGCALLCVGVGAWLATGTEVPTMLQLRSELRGAVPQPIAPYNIPKVDRRNIGVHIGSSVRHVSSLGPLICTAVKPSKLHRSSLKRKKKSLQ